MSDYVPLPWIAVTEGDDPREWFVKHKDWGIIASLHNPLDRGANRLNASQDGERLILRTVKAHAHLIAAAPRLLRVCEAALCTMESALRMKCVTGATARMLEIDVKDLGTVIGEVIDF